MAPGPTELKTTSAMRLQRAEKMKTLALPVALLLNGCAGIGLMATSDPYRKLQQSDYLMAQERAALAEFTIKDALETFKRNNDELGVAEAYHSLGNLYKNDSYHGKWAEYFKKVGTYDGTYMKSIDHFTKAMELFEKHSEKSGVVKCLVGIANAYGLRGEREKSCDYYNQSLERYNQAKQAGQLKHEPVMLNPQYKNMGDLIEAFMKYECGKSVPGSKEKLGPC